MPDSDRPSSSPSPASPPKIRFSESPLGGGNGGGAGRPSGLPPLGGVPAAPMAPSSGFVVEAPAAGPEAGTAELEPLPPDGMAPKAIRAFGPTKAHAAAWNRRPNVTGQGAIHVRTFHSKLNNDSLAYMDQTINEWLDQHPEYEVKFVTVAVGEFTGKIREPALICQVWV